MKTSEFVEAVKNELLTNGWCQRATADVLGRHCLTGAMSKVSSGVGWGNLISDENYMDSYHALILKAREMTGDKNLVSLPMYNDRFAKTRQDVIDLCEKTTAWLQERGE